MTRVHENMVQHPFNNISIRIYTFVSGRGKRGFLGKKIGVNSEGGGVMTPLLL